MHSFLPYAWFQGDCRPFADAKLSIATHALHYGTAAFGGLRAIPDPSGEPRMLFFRLDRHVRRLSQSAGFLCSDLPEEQIMAGIEAVIKANRPQVPIYLRPLVYTSDLGLVPRLHDIETDFLIYGMELGDYLSADGVSCRFSSWARQEDRSIPLRGKITGAYITSSLAKTEAVKSGFDEAILMNSQGKICEASGMNIFIVREGVLYTPAVNQDILEGITRASVITLARDMGYEVVERAVDKTELLLAEEAFLTGTAARIKPICRIETTTLPSHQPVAEQLSQRLKAICEGRDDAYRHWVMAVDW